MREDDRLIAGDGVVKVSRRDVGEEIESLRIDGDVHGSIGEGLRQGPDVWEGRWLRAGLKEVEVAWLPRDNGVRAGGYSCEARLLLSQQ